MSKPTKTTEWASDGAALKTDPDSGQQAFGWSTSDNTISGIPVKPNLQQQNGWQNAVYNWVEYLQTRTETSEITVAASDSSAENIAVSDFQCTGTDDQDVILSAIAQSITTGGKKVVLFDGTYVLSDSITISDDGISLLGSNEVNFSFSSNPNYGVEITGDSVTVSGLTVIDSVSEATSCRAFIYLNGCEYALIERIRFNTGAIRRTTADCGGIRLFANTFFCTVKEIFFDYESVNTTGGAGARSSAIYFGNNQPEQNDIYLTIQRRALVGEFVADGIYWDRVYHILREDPTARATHNNINTNWINYFGDVPDPASATTGFAYQQYQFRYNQGNIEMLLYFQWSAAAGAAVNMVFPNPPFTTTEINNHAIQGGGTKVYALAYRDQDGTVFPDASSDELFTQTNTGILVVRAGTAVQWADFGGSGMHGFGGATPLTIMFNEGTGSNRV